MEVSSVPSLGSWEAQVPAEGPAPNPTPPPLLAIRAHLCRDSSSWGSPEGAMLYPVRWGPLFTCLMQRGPTYTEVKWEARDHTARRQEALGVPRGCGGWQGLQDQCPAIHAVPKAVRCAKWTMLRAGCKSAPGWSPIKIEAISTSPSVTCLPAPPASGEDLAMQRRTTDTHLRTGGTSLGGACPSHLDSALEHGCLLLKCSAGRPLSGQTLEAGQSSEPFAGMHPAE